MKALLFTLLVFPTYGISQTGSALIKCMDAATRSPIPLVQFKFESDSNSIVAKTNDLGILLQRGLKPGGVRFLILPGPQKDTIRATVFIQENQLAQLDLYIDTANSWLYQGESGNNVQFSVKGINSPNETNTNYASGSVLNVQEIQCVMVTAYSVPLLSNDQHSRFTITREDITRLPVRSVNGIASTVGGVNTNETFDLIHIRGSRDNSTAYYLDGIRINNPNAIPKSFISEVNVYTSGIPANYGDLTGGVINIQSPSYHTLNTNRESRKRKNNDQIITDDPAMTPLNMNRVMSYDHFLPIYENDFLSPKDHPHSTFGLDVDRASWYFIKRQISMGGTITRDAVKIEEMINSFETERAEIETNELLNVSIERNFCSWNSDHELVTIHLKAKSLPKNESRKIHNLVFLIDVSGSMSSPDKLELLITGLKRFVKTLDERDRVAIVTYAGSSGVVLEPTSCNDQQKILEALDRLVSGGSTNGIGGITEAYKLAERNFDPALNNRIILCTDGDFNVGINSPGDLEKYIEEKRGKGIYLTALGFGMGNYHNSTLETLADKGDGNHFYISDLYDMNKVLVDDLGNLLNIARDVKLDVEFNPELVKSYRLIGYENRLLKPKDFTDDTKDGGEIGYGHAVTAVYEIEKGSSEMVESHFISSKETSNVEELAFVKLRYKPFEEENSIERRFSLSVHQNLEQNELLNLIIGLGLQLRDSAFKGSQSIESIQRLARDFRPSNEEEYELKKIILSLR